MLYFCQSVVSHNVLKECLTTVKQVFFHYKVGSLVDQRAYKPYTLVGPPALPLVLAPLSVYSLTTDYIYTIWHSRTFNQTGLWPKLRLAKL